jgi:hypothetical protein
MYNNNDSVNVTISFFNSVGKVALNAFASSNCSPAEIRSPAIQIE